MAKIVYANWKSGRSSVAKEDMPCAGFRCPHIIKQGEHFTRHTAGCGYYHHLLQPYCRTCIPFIIVPDNDLKVLIEEYKQTSQGAQDYSY